MVETLMTATAEKTNDAAATSTDASATPVVEAVVEPAKQQPTGDQTQTVKPADGKPADEGTDASKTEGAPEKYEFKAPEGQTYDESILTEFSVAAKEANLSQEAASKLLDKMGPALSASIVARNQAQIDSIQTQWKEASTNDKEFGGDKLQENLGVAKLAVDKFGSPELKKMLSDTGLGNNPEVIRFFYRAGKAISEDGMVTGDHAQTAKVDPGNVHEIAATLYPSRT